MRGEHEDWGDRHLHISSPLSYFLYFVNKNLATSHLNPQRRLEMTRVCPSQDR